MPAPIPCPITKEELYRLVHGEKLTDKEIAALIGNGATQRRVQSWRRRNGIETCPRWARNDVAPIEGKLKSLLVGSMLGDGRIVGRTNTSEYSESHSAKQKAYLEWKVKIWGEGWYADLFDVPDKRGYEQVRFRTVAHPDLNPWRKLFYEEWDKGWKRLLPELVDMVDELALAIWYLDDGHAGWWPIMTFGADEPSRQVALTIFEKFDLHPRWQPLKGKSGNFHMEREETAERFLRLIRPHVPECMEHKLGPFGFQGSHHQVRKKIDRETLEQLASEGIPIKRIGRMLGVGASTVSRRLKKWGIHHPRKIGNPGA